MSRKQREILNALAATPGGRAVIITSDYTANIQDALNSSDLPVLYFGGSYAPALQGLVRRGVFEWRQEYKGGVATYDVNRIEQELKQ